MRRVIPQIIENGEYTPPQLGIRVSADLNAYVRTRLSLSGVVIQLSQSPAPSPQAPNCNAHAERFVLSIKSECLNRMMFFGEASLRPLFENTFSTTTGSDRTRGAGTRRSMSLRGPRRGRSGAVSDLPEYGDADSKREVLDDFWPDLFAAMLNCWLTDEQQWPKDRTYQMFAAWFDI